MFFLLTESNIMKTIYNAFFALFLLTACSSDDQPAALLTSTEPQLVGKGNLYGGGSEGFAQQFSVITTTVQWEAFKDQLNTVNTVTDHFVETEIEFSDYIVIALIDQVRGSGGHSIDIVNVNEDRSHIFITVGHLSTGDATTVITQPYHIVKIPITQKEIIFNF